MRLIQRAQLLRSTRNFFWQREILEVMTPCIGRFAVTAPYIKSLSLSMNGENFFLQTSPEYAMKRLLAEGSGSIFQIANVYRDGESGQRHNPEFTMLEWYRPNINLEALMSEVDLLLQNLCDDLNVKREKASFISYRELFESRYQVNPHVVKVDELKDLANKHHPGLLAHLQKGASLDDILGLLFFTGIEPGLINPHFVYDYPRTQAQLAKLGERNGEWVALRFELFWKGMELANGYDELQDPKELSGRAFRDNEVRRSEGLPTMKMDTRLLTAIEEMPMCCGVALGLDRLQMLLFDQPDIKDVLSFDIKSV